MKPTSLYLERYGHPEQFIQTPPSQNLKLVVTVPCYNEPDLITSLSSLADCDQTGDDVEVVVMVNQPVDCNKEVRKNNDRTVSQFHEWNQEQHLNWIRFRLAVATDIPKRRAGVGHARKMAMDEAVRRLLWAQRPDTGVIVGFDADCLCDKNYLRAVEDHFLANPTTDGCSIYFEHTLEGPFDKKIYQGITRYELHLRYLVNALRFSGLPFAFHTLGSAMAVRCSVYQSQGGMNRRKAGEDFHFLQKVMAQGRYSDLTATRILPSPRTSDRVPFGTGKAMMDWVNSTSPSRETYNPAIFDLLKLWIATIPGLYDAHGPEITSALNSLPKPLREFLVQIDFSQRIEEINRQSTSEKTFVNRFYRTFNALKVLKLVHHLRDRLYPNVEVTEAANSLLKKSGRRLPKNTSARELLLIFREIDRGKQTR